MNTRKEISTVGYQSKEFLISKFNELIYAHTISDYMMIRHKAEEDEKKDHWHIWLMPNEQVDSMDLQEFLTEFNPQDPTKPFKCINFHYSQSDDWIPYCLHDKSYLALKHESRKFKYQKEDIIFYDEDTFDYLYYQAYHCSKWCQDSIVVNKILDSIDNPIDLIKNGTLSYKDSGYLRNTLYLMNYNHTIRGDHKGHE